MSEMQSEEKQEVLNKQDIEREKEKKEQVRQVVAEVIQSEFSGPIPPPNIIKGYEDVLPGAADRILSMAEKQSNHRQEMERTIIKAESRDGLLGVLFAFLLGLGCIVAAIVIVCLVPQNSGAISSSVLGVAGIGSIIATFIKGTRTTRSDKNSPKGVNKKENTPQQNNEKQNVA